MRFILILLCAVFLPTQAQAMNCQNDPNGIYNYEIVFKGEAVSTQKVDEKNKIRSDDYYTPARVTRFKVLRKYKGPISEFVDVYHPDSDDVYTKDSEGNYTVRGSIPGISIKFKMGDVRHLFLNRGKGSDQYAWRPCSPWASNVRDLLPLEEFKARADMFSEIASTLHALPRAAARRGEFSNFYLKQAMFHEKYNDFDAALEAYKNSFEMQLRPSQVPSDNTLDALIKIDIGRYGFYKFGVGKIYLKQERYEDALVVFDKVLKSIEKHHSDSEEGKRVSEMVLKYRDMARVELEKQNP